MQVAPRTDQRSPEAEQYRRWYKTARWQRIRIAQLQHQPLCERCLKAKPRRITPATVVHHVEPHKGDAIRFWLGPFESLCAPHHDADAQGEEHRGYSAEVGSDGWPTDERHPANR